MRNIRWSIMAEHYPARVFFCFVFGGEVDYHIVERSWNEFRFLLMYGGILPVYNTAGKGSCTTLSTQFGVPMSCLSNVFSALRRNCTQ